MNNKIFCNLDLIDMIVPYIVIIEYITLFSACTDPEEGTGGPDPLTPWKITKL